MLKVAKKTSLQVKIDRIKFDIEALKTQIKSMQDMLIILEQPEPDIENGQVEKE